MAKAPVPLDFYAGLIRDQERQRESDPVGEALARMRTEDVRRTIVDSPAPDEAAKVNRVARETGDQHALIEDRLPDYEKAMGAQRFADVASRYSVLGKYFNDNPRAAIAAQDDHRSLGILGEAWDTIKKVPESLDVAGYTAMGMANDTLYSLSDIGSAVGYPFRAAAATAINSPIGRALGIPAYDPDKQDAQVDAFKQSLRSSLQRRTDAARPAYVSSTQEGLLRGLDTSVATVMALLTRNPTTAASTLGTTVGAQGYQDARADGVGPGDAIRYGLTQGAVETLTEVAPASSLLSSLAKRAGPGKTIAGYLAAELPGELSATFLQSLSDWQVRNPEKTYNDWVKSLPSEARQTVLGVLGGGTVTAVAAKSAQVGADLVRRADDALRARAHADVLTRFEKAATESKYRARDPEGYSEMIGEVAKQSGVEHVFVPADAVREYMQSDSYDPYSDPLEAYRDAVDEAYEVGGDVVLPSDFALGTLPGTSAWSALKDDMRLTAGGITPREAQTFEEAMADVVAEVEASQQKEFDSLQAQIDAQGKLLKSVQDKLMNAGFTPYAAQQNATLIVQRIATRAARMGQELTGGEFTTEVRQVLPPELAAARDADATDLVINALRKGRDPASQSGPSLLEWISARGGVNDTGGDLASMGLDQWHRGKPGKRKLLRKFDPTAALGGVSGAGDYGIDNTLRAAIEAGFFPELVGVENEAGASQLDTQALLDAMSAELAGVKRYAADARVDGYRAAAQELDDLLRQRGLDPDGMSDAELRDAIAQLDQAGPEDGAFYQTDSQGRPLVVVHNLSAENFRNADELGGLAAPSIAVIRADLDWSNFGEISLIGSPDLIDPKKDRAAKGFNADVYSPRQPRARYDLHGPTLKKLRFDMEQAARDIGETFSSEFDNDKLSREGLSAIENSPVAKLAYLRSIGIDVKPGYDDKPVIDKRLRKFKGTDYWSIANDPAFVKALKPLFEEVVTTRDGRLRDAYFDENGEPQWRMVESYARDVARFNRPAEVNRWKTREAIDKKLNANKNRPAEFRKWVQDNYAGLIAGKFFEARDSGRRRDYTMDNLVREMTRTIRDGEGYNYGVGSLRSNVAKQFRSIEDMQASRDSIISDKEMDAIKSEVTDELFALADKFAPYHRSSGDFGWPDIFTLFLKDLSAGRIREWQESIFSEPVPGELLNQARDFLDKLRGLPTEYFEVKMQRAVDLSEFEAAVVPDNAPADVVARLKDLGLKVASYPAGGSRQAAIAEVAGLSKNRVFFQSPREYYQSADGNRALNDGPRGRIRFEQVPVIELFQGRNLSTLLHELGHQYLEELRYDATGLTAPDQLIKDWETTQAWFKANGYEVVDGFIPTEAHELWARGFERYLMEGKAPSSALARVFETFRGWLMSIYKKVDALRSPITPEIREVFDRLLATDEELQQQREAHALMPLFKDAAEIMTRPEFQAYQDQFNEARVDAQSEALAKAMREVKARVTKEYRDQRAIVEADVTESVDARPLFKALRNLKTMPVRKGWLEDNMGLDVFDLMPKRVPPLWSDKGSHPDAVAEMSGYGSGRQMIEALIGAEMAHRQAVEGGDKRILRERTIQSEVDAIMRERYGDPLTDGTIEREALAAVNNEKQGEVLASELRILSRKTGQRPTPYRIARQWARNKVRQGVYATEASPSAIQRHARAVSKHGSEAEKAMLAGKFDEAFAAKQKQMLSSALLAEAKAANDEVTAAQKRMDKIARRQTSKSVDQDYLDQAHALLEQVDLRPRSQKSIDRQGKWAEWAAAREAEGFDVVVPASFEATLGKTNWTRLPVETMLALDETVQQIMHLGRLKQSLLDGKERREWDEIYKEAEDSAGGLKGNPPRDLMEPGFWDAIKSGAASLDGALLKMETVFDWLDGGNSNGVFNRIAFRPVADAQGREQDMLVDYYGRIKALFEAVPAEVASRWQDKVSPPFVNRETGLPERMKRHQLIAAALNVGNAGNLQRLTDGYGWNSAALLDYLNSELTAEEWQFVQGVWDTIDTLWPEIEAMERRVNGVAPERVEATEIVTPFGTLRGGYYPAIYDTSRSYRQEENRAAGENTLFEPNAVRATTRSGSTKARAEQVTAPILLDLGVINRHLGEVIHDITHREAVMQAWKFLTSERVMRAVDQALGPEIRKQFKPWVKFVANSWAMERAGNEGFGKFLTKLRANATVVGMGLRATTMMTQIAGYSNSIEAVGEKWVAEAIARSTASPVESFDFVMANSDEVRHRMDTLDRDIRNELAAMTATNPATKLGRTLLEGRKFFFHGIGYMDRVVVVPTWLAAYNKATAEGMDHDDARYAADKAVRVSQGSGAPKDMAAIQRGTGRYGEALKLMTMFYTYLSAFYQRQRTLYRDATGEDVRRPRDFPKLASRAFWLIVLPPILTEILRAAAGADAGPDDDEWWAQWYLRKLLVNSVGPIPLVRDVFEPAWNKARGGDWFQTSISPIQRGLESIVNTAGDIGNIARGEETKKATKNALETIGYTTGLIPGQVASAAQFLVDVAEGDADPETWSDWMEGLSTGKIKDE